MKDNNYTVIFRVEYGEELSVSAVPGESLLDAARRANIPMDAPCGGNGTCGKCRVKLLVGELDGGPARHISKEDYDAGFALACLSTPVSDVTVFIPGRALAYQSRIKVSGKGEVRERQIFTDLRQELDAMALGGDLGLEVLPVTVTPPDLGNAMADRERLLGAIAKIEAPAYLPEISLHALRKLPQVLRDSAFSLNCVIRKEGDRKRILDVFPAGSADAKPGVPRIAGLAIDIGTTTVSMLLIDLETGEIAAQGSAGNGQIRYGADVISRIIESTRPGGLERLRAAITPECIEPLVRRICATAGIPEDRVYRAAVAANTTMTHFFMGVQAEHLRLEPYVPAFFQSGILRGAETGMNVHPEAEILIAPSIGSYVGGDITAGVFASMIFKRDTISLFIDLGTNGELVFGSSEFLFACACSAGPAFEGGDISCGMRATDGAIEACRIDADTMDLTITVVGAEQQHNPEAAQRVQAAQRAEAAQRAAGLCGSGIIDLIGELFRCGIINAKGKFIKTGKRIKRDEWGLGSFVAAWAAESATGEDICLTETDIDNFIRAKGAIFSAIRTMLAVVDYPVDAIEDVYVAGGIGSGINMKQAIRIGMFPDIDIEKYHYIGNSSMMGAYAMLTSRRACDMVTEIAGGMTYLELSSHPGYMDEFVAASFLPHTDGRLFKTHD